MNRSCATDSQSTADKQTSMPQDVASAYLASTVSRRVVSVSRGTSTTPSSTSPQVDRATSPQRVTLVDKAVTASKAEALEPVDTFQAAGQLSGCGPLSPRTRRPVSLSPRSKLACISESAEQQCEQDPDDDVNLARRGCQTGSCQPGLASTQPQQQQRQHQLCRNVFNFDTHVFAKSSGLAASSLDDIHTTSPSSASGSDVIDDVIH